MCIRDSFEIPENSSDTVSEKITVEKLPFTTDVYGIARIEAVSYTHLRAHETVLDIVCRLLLEKKTDRSKTMH